MTAFQAGSGTSGAAPGNSLDAGHLSMGNGVPLTEAPFVIEGIAGSNYSKLLLRRDLYGSVTPPIVGHQTRTWTVNYPDAGIIAIAENRLAFPSHGVIQFGIEKIVNENPALGIAQEKIGRFVDGFIDGNFYIVRIDDHSDLLKELTRSDNKNWDRDRQELDMLLLKYQKAIELNERAARLTHGEVVLLPMGDDVNARLIIPKMLHRLHQTILQDDLPGPTFVEKAKQQIKACTVYYSVSQRIRFITPDQFGDMALIVPQKEVFIEALNDLIHLTNSKGDAEKVEARFLLVDPHTEKLIENDSMMTVYLNDLQDTVLSFAESAQPWSAAVPVIKQEILALASLLRSKTHACLRHDPDHLEDSKNSEYVRIVSDVLHRGGVKLPLGTGFSTQLKAVEAGFFAETIENGREFVHATPVRAHQLLISWVMHSFPQARSGDWFCICDPEIQSPLTHEHHPFSFVAAFGDLPDPSYVVLFGEIGEGESRLVARENQYGVKTWAKRNTPKIAELRALCSDRDLTDAVEFCQKSQHFLSSALTRIGKTQHSVDAAPFEPILSKDLGQGYAEMYDDGDMMYRPFYDGDRLDFARLTTWTRNQIEQGLLGMAEVIAKNVIKQAPFLEFSSQVISKIDPRTGCPTEFTSLSFSQTFCDSLGITNPDTYLRTIKTRDASFVATWIESFMAGEHGQEIPVEERGNARAYLRKVFLGRYRQTLRNIVRAETDGEDNFSTALDQVKQNYAELRQQFKDQGKMLPPVLDMTQYIQQTKNLLRAVSIHLDKNVRSLDWAIHAACRERQKIFEVKGSTKIVNSSRIEESQLGHDVVSEQREIPDYALREKYLKTVNAVINDHFYDHRRFPEISSVINGGAFDLAPFSLQERVWIFTIADKAARLAANKFPYSREVLHAVESVANIEDFLRVVNEKYPGSNLPAEDLQDLYQAVYGLHNFSQLSEENPKKIALREILTGISGLLGGFKEVRKAV